MKQNINKDLSDRAPFTSANLANSVQEKKILPDDLAQKNKARQQEQTSQLSRMLEAYGDCV